MADLDPTVILAVMAALLFGLLAGAYLGHQLHTCRYRRALQRVVEASNDPTNRRLGRELDDADNLLKGPQ